MNQSYSASSLRIENIACQVEISVERVPPSPDIAIRLEMTTERAAKIERRIRGDELVIRDVFEGTTIRSGGMTVINRGSVIGSLVVSGGAAGAISITDGRVFINGREMKQDAGLQEPPAKLFVRVPLGTAIAIESPISDVEIGDTEGSLVISAGASGDVRAGRIKTAMIQVQGSSDVEIAEVLGGSVSVQLQGSGDVEVGGGTIDSLGVGIMGSGDFTFDGEARSSSLSVMGSGSIRVRRVTGACQETVLGTGRIRVAKRGPAT